MYDPDLEPWQMDCGRTVYGEEAIAEHEDSCDDCREGSAP